MPSFVSGTFVIPSDAPYGSYTFSASGGGLSISEPSAVKIYNNYITPDTGSTNTSIPFTIYVNSSGVSFYYSSNVTFCDFIRFKQSNGSWEWDIQPTNPNPSQNNYYLSSPFVLTGTFPKFDDYFTNDVTFDVTLNDMSDGGSTLITLDSQFTLTV